MQVENNTQVISFQNWTFRVHLPEKRERLLVLIHGYKGDENSMWVFTNGLKANYCIIAPRAPFKVRDGGYSWRPAEVESLSQMPPDSLRLQTMNLLEVITGFAGSIEVNQTPFDMIGFSQGAAVIYLLAINHPGMIRKAALLGGFPPIHGGEPFDDNLLAGKHFFIAHGTRDDKVPVEQGKLMVGQLEKAGAKVTYCEDDVGHKVSSRCLRAMKSYLVD